MLFDQMTPQHASATLSASVDQPGLVVKDIAVMDIADKHITAA